MKWGASCLELVVTPLGGPKGIGVGGRGRPPPRFLVQLKIWKTEINVKLVYYIYV